MNNMRLGSMRNIIKVHLLVLGLLFISSCHIIRKYQRPDDLNFNSSLHWTEGKDSASIAMTSWKDFFKDSLLKQHIATALNNNLDVKDAYSRLNIAKAYLDQSTQAFAPTLSLGPSVSYQTSSQNSQLGGLFGERKHIIQYELGLNVGWEADIWGKLKSARRSAYAQMMQSDMVVNTIKSRLVAEISGAYYQLMALDRQKEILEVSIANRKQNLETTKALKDAGILNIVAVQQSEAQTFNAEAQLENTLLSIQQLENYICKLEGTVYHPISRAKLSDRWADVALMHGVPSDLLSNRPDVLQAEYALQSSVELENVARAQMYPSLRIDASTGLQSIDFSNLFSIPSLFASAVGSLTQPILNRGVLRTMKRVSELQKNQAYLNYKNTLIQASSEVTDALFSIDAQDKILDLKKKEYEAYESAIANSKELVNYGMTNYLEVLLATDNSLQAQIAYTNAFNTKWQSVIQLYLALGGGWR